MTIVIQQGWNCLKIPLKSLIIFPPQKQWTAECFLQILLRNTPKSKHFKRLHIKTIWLHVIRPRDFISRPRASGRHRRGHRRHPRPLPRIYYCWSDSNRLRAAGRAERMLDPSFRISDIFPSLCCFPGNSRWRDVDVKTTLVSNENENDLQSPRKVSHVRITLGMSNDKCCPSQPRRKTSLVRLRVDNSENSA